MTAPVTSKPSTLLAPRLPAGIDTPAVVIDLDVVERNAHRLGTALAERGIALRPHAKTHKSIALARLQLAAGARGITVGNLGEAEVFAAGGLDAVIERVSDYHGVVRIPPGTPKPRVGEALAVIPNHVCPVIDLSDSFIATRAGVVVGTWPVDARGRSG